MRARRGGGQALELEGVALGLDAAGGRGADHVEPDARVAAAAGRAGQVAQGGDRPVEPLVPGDEPDAEEHELVGGDAQHGSGLVAVERGVGHEVLAVLDEVDPRPRHPEGVDQLVALGLVVDLDAVERLQQEAGGTARHVGGLAPALVDLVQHQRGGRTGPQGRAEREEAHQPHLEGGRLGEEHVGVEVDDEAVEAPGEPRQAAHAARVVQVEVVVRGRRPGREHLDVVALAAQRPHLLHGVGADAVAVGRVGRHEQDALGHHLGGGGRVGHGERAHCQASRLASTRSSVTGQV